MLKHTLRATILELSQKGLGTRRIARTLGVSRGAVKRVIASGTEAAPKLERPSPIEGHRAEILELSALCKGNLVRVHEELQASGQKLSYPALTAFVRRQMKEPPVPAGQYHFEPGQEIQHDTSPHDVSLGGKTKRMQTASAVLCYSRMLFFQLYPCFTRFEAKAFLTEALKYFGGSAKRVMVDNTNVVRSHGTGADMVPAPEMAAFGERFGFVFIAHAVGNANRSGRVERPFDFIENNFLAGRSLENVKELNEAARAWCTKVNGTYKRHLHAIPRELFALERLSLKPLPAFIPEPEKLFHRIVDLEGYVSVETNRYSAPADWMGRRVQVRVTTDRVSIDEADRTVVHERLLEPLGRRLQLPEHRVPRGEKALRVRQLDEEKQLQTLLPGIGDYLCALKKNGRKAPVLLLRRLLQMAREYPGEPLAAALKEAAQYRMYDLDRLERMVLKRVAHEYFLMGDDDE